jgi:predicted kinase
MKTGNYVYLSPDDILTEGGKLAYNMVYTKKAAQAADVEVFARLKQAVTERKNVIVDQTNTDPDGRARKASIIPDKYYHKVAINFISCPERIKERNEKRKKEGKDMSYEVIRGKMKQYQLAGTDIFHESKTILT